MGGEACYLAMYGAQGRIPERVRAFAARDEAVEYLAGEFDLTSEQCAELARSGVLVLNIGGGAVAVCAVAEFAVMAED